MSIMEPANILVVEDEPIVAKDIQLSLRRLGYRVPATATSGEEAIRKTKESHPDLILMDIVLKGKMDGVETVQQIRKQYDVPVIYLTAYADDHTLERAKVTSPAGYMLKPYQPNELRTTIELALHRAHHDRHMNENLKWLATTVRCIGEGIMTTDRDGRITYMNPAAEDMVGWKQPDAKGVSLATLIGFGPEGSLQGTENPATIAMAEVHIVQMTGSVLPSKSDARRSIVGSVAPVLDDIGMVIGSVLVFRKHQQTLQCGHHEIPVGDGLENEGRLGAPQGIINLCAWCKRVPDKFGEWYDLETFVTERSALQFNGGLCPECMGRCFPESGGHL